MVKTRRYGRKKCGGRSRKPKYNMKGCASKRHKHYGGAIDSGPIAPLSILDANKIGGSNCPSCDSPTRFEPILGSYQNGGCSTCGTGMTGGSFYKTDLPPVPAPFVHEPWGARVSQWPGVDGVDSGRNYFTNNLYDKGDPQTMMKLYDWGGKGGSKSRRRIQQKSNYKPKCNCKCNCKCKNSLHKKGLKGGSVLPDFVSLGRDLSYNFESMYNSMNGYNAPVNPKPYIQPALSESHFKNKYY